MVIFSFYGNLRVHSQIGTIQWQRSLGGSDSDGGFKIKSGPDRSFFLVGSSKSNNADIPVNYGESDIVILKIDSLGAMNLINVIGGTSSDGAISFDFTDDGGFIIGGTTNSNDVFVTGNHGQSDYWIVKLDSARNIQWQKCYGGPDRESVSDIQQTTDSGFIVLGRTSSLGGNVWCNHGCNGCSVDFWTLKLDKYGNIQWQRCLGGIGEEFPGGLAQTSDGGYVFCGSASFDNGDVSGCHGYSDYWVVKLDSTGVMQWQRCLGGSSNDAANSIVSTTDGGCLVFGEASSNDGDVSANYGSWDAWLVKLDSFGNIEWDRNYGGSGSESGKALYVYNDTAIYLLSFSQSTDGDVSGNHGYGDFWIAKTDINGNLLWEKCFGGSNIDMPTSVYVINDFEFIMTGYSRSNDGDVSGNHGGNCNGFVCEDIWVVKINDTNVSVNEFSDNNFLKIYPNPFYQTIKISIENSFSTTIDIYNVLGQIKFSKEIIGTEELDLSFIPSGIYFLECRNGNKKSVHKIVKQD